MDGNQIIIQRLSERGYFIKNILGTGGFGTTYLTVDKSNKETLVVIKTINNELLFQSTNFNKENLELLTRSINSFINEAKILLNHKHPNIVKIYSFLNEPFELPISNKNQSDKYTHKLELLFLIMEYIEGENLEKLVKQRGFPLQEAEALHYIQQIGGALVFIHSQSLLHRDINPKNIMVRKATEEAVLIDFGISRYFIPEITESISRSYTPNYTPIEQRRQGQKTGEYTDIYGLAATLYYLLTEKPPADVLERKFEDLEEPQKINPNISDKVNEAILWGMELDFRERPQTVKEWLELLNTNKVKFDEELLSKYRDELKKATISLFKPTELDYFLVDFNIDYYDDLDGKYLPQKVKCLIDQFPEDYIKTFIEAMKKKKPEAFT